MTQAGNMLERESETGRVICSSAKEWIFPKKVGRIKAHFPFLIELILEQCGFAKPHALENLHVTFDYPKGKLPLGICGVLVPRPSPPHRYQNLWMLKSLT